MSSPRFFSHWFLLVQSPPIPEPIVQNSANYFPKCTLLWLSGSKLTDPQPDWIGPAVFQEYLGAFRQPDTIHAICEDYRAAVSIDLAHDKADLDKKIQCPLRMLCSEEGCSIASTTFWKRGRSVRFKRRARPCQRAISCPNRCRRN
jgi:haloacetate dehalogenase